LLTKFLVLSKIINLTPKKTVIQLEEKMNLNKSLFLVIFMTLLVVFISNLIVDGKQIISASNGSNNSAINNPKQINIDSPNTAEQSNSQWLVRTYNTDDRGAVFINGRMVAGSTYSLYKDSGFVDATKFFNSEGDTNVSFASWDLGICCHSTWGFQLKHNEEILITETGSTNYALGIRFAKTFTVTQDGDFVQYVQAPPDTQLEGNWELTVRSNGGFAFILLDNLPIAGSTNNKTQTLNISNLLGQGDNHIHLNSWADGNKPHTLNFELKKNGVVLWQTNKKFEHINRGLGYYLHLVINSNGTVDLDCSESREYEGIQHCSKDKAQILIVDPQTVRFETVLAQGFDINEDFGECKDVNTPAWIPIITENGGYPGPRCHTGINSVYPAEFMGEMAQRDPNNIAAVAFNGDYFDHDKDGGLYQWGPQGLTVKNGNRYDGFCYGDDDAGIFNGSNNPHFAVSIDHQINIGVAGNEAPENCNPNEEILAPYVTNRDKYYQAIGGGPIIVENGVSVVERECLSLQSYCPHRYSERARTVVGQTSNGEFLIVVVPEDPGITLDNVAELLISLGATNALNLDGGGSSQLWYDNRYLVDSYDDRRVPNGMLIFSTRIDTYSINGHITDNEGNPIDNVNVSVNSSNTQTQPSGTYDIGNLLAGNYTITPSKFGYSFEPQTLQVKMPPNAYFQDFEGTTCPVIASLNSLNFLNRENTIGTKELIDIYSALRDELLSESDLGQEYIGYFNEHRLEFTEILVKNPELRTRTGQFLNNAAPTFDSLLSDADGEIILTQELYDEALNLLNDLSKEASPDLQSVMNQTWEDLSLHNRIGESPDQIWEEIQLQYLYLPIIQNTHPVQTQAND
jgi:exopolysaccharide biosynthesis protein